MKNTKIIISLFLLTLCSFAENTFAIEKTDKELEQESIMEMEKELERQKAIKTKPKTATASPRVKFSGSKKDSFYGKYYYNKYQELYREESFFPLGYTANIEFTYYSKLQQGENKKENYIYWESVIQQEKGTFKNGNGEVLATFVTKFDKNGNVISFKKKGFSVVMKIFNTIATVLGISTPSGKIISPKSQSSDRSASERVE